MKSLFYVCVFLLSIGVALLYINIRCDLEDYKVQVEIEKYESEKRIAELEKDIRILKTDSYINTNGFEGVESE